MNLFRRPPTFLLLSDSYRLFPFHSAPVYQPRPPAFLMPELLLQLVIIFIRCARGHSFCFFLRYSLECCRFRCLFGRFYTAFILCATICCIGSFRSFRTIRINIVRILITIFFYNRLMSRKNNRIFLFTNISKFNISIRTSNNCRT